jgi:urease accessory protein UreE
LPTISLVEIKKLARERLPQGSSVLTTLLDTDDVLEWNTENCIKVELLWELVVAAVRESRT